MYNDVDDKNNEIEHDIDQSSNEAEMKPKRKSSFGKFLVKVIAVAAIAGIVVGAGYVGVNYVSDKIQKNDIIEDVATENEPTETTPTEMNYTGVSEIVANVKPSIVAITSTTQEVTYDFFGRPYVTEAAGAGSGIIVGQSAGELLIATNNHVISGATNIVIQFIDDSTATGIVKGSDMASDLAVVSVDVNDLSDETIKKIRVATLGNSDECQQGELVIAIGNALGYGQSTTVGYISALNREVTVDDLTLDLLQTDAAINPGNSGGALLNAKGEVIGINSVKLVETKVEGIGYAIPITTAVPIINDLMNRSELSDRQKGYLGIAGNDVTEAESKMLNIPIGIYVTEVEAGSPADQAGIRVRDIITGVNGRSLETKEALSNYLNYTKAGTKVTLNVSVNDNGNYVEKEIEVTLSGRK